MALERTSTLVVLLLGLGAAGCGEEGPADVAPSIHSDSFSPARATTAAGAPAPELWWRHRVNEGVATAYVSNDGNPGKTTFGERLTRILDGGSRRLTTGSATTTLDGGNVRVTGTETDSLDETLTVGSPIAVADRQQITMTNSAGGGRSLKFTVRSVLTTSMPLVDFGDRADLDQLPVGHVDEVMVTTTLSGTATESDNGGPNMTGQLTGTGTEHVLWKVVEQLQSMMVLGKTYGPVVRMEVTQELTDTQTAGAQTVTNTYWLAKGIGIISSLQQSAELPFPVKAELIDTNLGL